MWPRGPAGGQLITAGTLSLGILTFAGPLLPQGEPMEEMPGTLPRATLLSPLAAVRQKHALSPGLCRNLRCVRGTQRQGAKGRCGEKLMGKLTATKAKPHTRRDSAETGRDEKQPLTPMRKNASHSLDFKPRKKKKIPRSSFLFKLENLQEVLQAQLHTKRESVRVRVCD